MSEHNTAPGEQPAPETAPTETPGAQPANLDPTAAIDDLSQEQLGNLLFSGAPQTAAEAAPESIPAATKPPETTTPPEPDGEQPILESGKPDLRRVALGGVPLSERQQIAEVARMIRSGEASTQVEALQKMGVLQTAQATPPTTTETTPEGSEATPPGAQPTETPAPSTDQVATLESRIAELRAQRDQAEEDYDVTEKRRLTAEIEDTVGLLAQARIEAREQQASASQFQDAYAQAVDAMEAKHAWATDPESPLYEALNDKVTAAMARQDPALNDPNYIINFADQIAARFGNATKTPPPPPPTQAPRIVGGGVAPGHSQAHTPTEAEAMALIANASMEQLAAGLF